MGPYFATDYTDSTDGRDTFFTTDDTDGTDDLGTNSGHSAFGRPRTVLLVNK